MSDQVVTAPSAKALDSGKTNSARENGRLQIPSAQASDSDTKTSPCEGGRLQPVGGMSLPSVMPMEEETSGKDKTEKSNE